MRTAEISNQPKPRRVSGKTLLRQLPFHLVLIPGLVFTLIPLAWTISTSLSDLGHVFQWPIRWIPNPVRWDNYVQAMQIQPFGIDQNRNTNRLANRRNKALIRRSAERPGVGPAAD